MLNLAQDHDDISKFHTLESNSSIQLAHATIGGQPIDQLPDFLQTCFQPSQKNLSKHQCIVAFDIFKAFSKEFPEVWHEKEESLNNLLRKNIPSKTTKELL